MNKIRFLKYGFLILFINSIFYFFIIYKIDNETNNRLNKITKRVEIKIEASINSQNVVNELIFNELINKESILKLYSKAFNADSITKKSIRESLYIKLLPVYEILKSYNIRQLHFQTTDNISFLRFHRPNKFGDDLTDIRYSIKMANKTLKSYKGFEEGRIFNGFRYVYPLFYNEKHIGSLEASFSFKAIENQLLTNNVSCSHFLLDKSVVESKVFLEEQSNYKQSKLLNNYMFEKEMVHEGNHISDDILKEIKNKIKDKIIEKVNKKENFTTYHKIGNDTYLVSFIFIKNLEDKNVAVIIAYEKNNIALSFQQTYNYLLVIGFIIIPLIIILIGLYLIKNKLIKEKNITLEVSESKLKKTNTKLVKANATKDKFFRIIAHDLRNPIGSILGLTELLVENFEEYDKEKAKKIIKSVYTSSKHTYKLLNNLLEWSRAQQDRTPFNPVKTELQPLLLEVVLLLSSQAALKQITISEKTSKNLMFYFDNEMIKTVIRNLVSNAIKYTNKGGDIYIKAKKNNEKVLISISDTGIGMNEKTKKSLFKIAETESMEGTEGERGSGFGLMICKEFIEKHNGSISVKSEINKGSEFIIELPIKIKNN